MVGENACLTHCKYIGEFTFAHFVSVQTRPQLQLLQNCSQPSSEVTHTGELNLHIQAWYSHGYDQVKFKIMFLFTSLLNRNRLFVVIPTINIV